MTLRKPAWVGILLSSLLSLTTMSCTPRSDPDSGSLGANQEEASSGDRPEVFFPQLGPPIGPRAFPEALIQGTLYLSRGCLRVGAEGEGSLIIWPPQVQLERNGDSIRLLDESSKVEVEIGQTVRLGGGEIEPGAPILRELREDLPSHCPGPYWLASGLISF